MKDQKTPCRRGRLNIKNILFGTMLVLGLLIVLGYGTVKAYEGNPEEYPPVVQKLVERFGLNEDEVKAVFDEVRTERQAQRQAEREERLDQAVADGVISEEQKNSLQAKWEEHKQARGAYQGEMKAWFNEQGIEPQALKDYLGFGPRGSRRLGFKPE